MNKNTLIEKNIFKIIATSLFFYHITSFITKRDMVNNLFNMQEFMFFFSTISLIFSFVLYKKYLPLFWNIFIFTLISFLLVQINLISDFVKDNISFNYFALKIILSFILILFCLIKYKFIIKEYSIYNKMLTLSSVSFLIIFILHSIIFYQSYKISENLMIEKYQLIIQSEEFQNLCDKKIICIKEDSSKKIPLLSTSSKEQKPLFNELNDFIQKRIISTYSMQNNWWKYNDLSFPTILINFNYNNEYRVIISSIETKDLVLIHIKWFSYLCGIAAFVWYIGLLLIISFHQYKFYIKKKSHVKQN